MPYAVSREYARTGEDMTIDYVLLDVPLNHGIDPTLILDPDPRGLPQSWRTGDALFARE